MRWERSLVNTGRSSLVVGGPGELESLASRSFLMTEEGRRLLVITDDNVYETWGPQVKALLGAAVSAEDFHVIPAGETSKSVDMLAACWDWLAERGCRRSDVVLALGGGVVGDLAGFVAATYQRGVGLWQVPTTLLSQIDSSVGGKTAVNISAGKNLVGAFYQPDLVLVDPDTLGTLPDAEFRAGLGEMVKYGLLDGGFLPTLEKNKNGVLLRNPEVVSSLVARCIAYKASVVEKDELDRGGRAVLNLGHTVGHALEVTLGYGALSHGFAVGLGLLVALAVSESMLGLDPGVRMRARSLLDAWGLPTSIALPETSSILAAAAKDKKVVAGTTGFVGLRRPGEPAWGLRVEPETLVDSLEVIRS